MSEKQPSVGYLGSFCYTEDPEALGEYDEQGDLGGGFYRFANYAELWHAFEISEAFNRAYETLGEPTYSRILTGADANGYIIFHVLVLSLEPVYEEREQAILAKTWALLGVDV